MLFSLHALMTMSLGSSILTAVDPENQDIDWSELTPRPPTRGILERTCIRKIVNIVRTL
jgi:hypothetical protein